MPHVLIHDSLTPEDSAMLQALYSRSAASVTSHLDKVRESGSGKFMERFYIGYGHRSIGDCGSTTIFIEGISELAAKAIQDWPLYSGQQTSTRYIDFTRQTLLDPAGTPASRAILDRWMAFYTGRMDAVRDHLAACSPWNPADGDQASWERAIRARSFDVMRAFLPAGVTTQLSWHTNLRQAADKLDLLRYHPLDEVRKLADILREKLAASYPHSFGGKEYPDQEAWREALVAAHTYLDAPWPPASPRQSGLLPAGCASCDWTSLSGNTVQPESGFELREDGGGLVFASDAQFDRDEIARWIPLLSSRPVKTDLPQALDSAGLIRTRFVLDYGSFRDLQRHRHGVVRMPLLTARHGFEPWYLAMLPERIRDEALVLCEEQSRAVEALGLSPEKAQYYLAFGYRVVCECAWGLPSAVYVAEMRSGQTVHPTLRRIAQALGTALQAAIPEMALHIDNKPEAFSLKRGGQDIVEKKQ